MLLFVLNIAKSGERKSTVDRTFEKGIRSWERLLQMNINHYEQKAMADGSSPRLIYEDATAEGLAAELKIICARLSWLPQKADLCLVLLNAWRSAPKGSQFL